MNPVFNHRIGTQQWTGRRCSNHASSINWIISTEIMSLSSGMLVGLFRRSLDKDRYLRSWTQGNCRIHQTMLSLFLNRSSTSTNVGSEEWYEDLLVKISTIFGRVSSILDWWRWGAALVLSVWWRNHFSKSLRSAAQYHSNPNRLRDNQRVRHNLSTEIDQNSFRQSRDLLVFDGGFQNVMRVWIRASFLTIQFWVYLHKSGSLPWLWFIRSNHGSQQNRSSVSVLQCV